MMFPPGRRTAKITSQDASIAEPPANGVKLKTDATGFCVTEEVAAIDHLNQLIAGRCDQGPVHATTTQMSTMYGIHTKNARRIEFSSAKSEEGATAGVIFAPPNPRITFGCQIFTNRKRAQNETSAPLKSGKYGPK